ncbi:MAG: hypothetical protein V4738_01160 [Pseudomonadota bacterium]
MKHLTAALFVVTTGAALAQPNPVAEFASVFATCKNGYQTQPVGDVFAPPTGGTWQRKVASEFKLNYDVRQKDAASPYTATIQIELMESFDTAATQEAAKQLVPGPSNRSQRDKVNINFVYQNSFWRTTTADLVTETRPRTADAWGTTSTRTIDRDAVISSRQPWVICAR